MPWVPVAARIAPGAGRSLRNVVEATRRVREGVSVEV
jgi:hypothetical protein